MRHALILAALLWISESPIAWAATGTPTAVVATSSTELEDAMRREMAKLTRFEIVESPRGLLAEQVRYVRDLAKQVTAAPRGYVLSVSHSFAPLRRSGPTYSKSTDKKTRVITTTSTLTLQSELRGNCEVIDAVTGQIVRRIAVSVGLSKPITFKDTSKDTSFAASNRVSTLMLMADAEARTPVQDLFGNAFPRLAAEMVWELRKAPPFQLRAPILAHQRWGDLLTIDLGRSSQVRMDDTFMIMRQERILGFARVHGLGQERSAAQVIALDEPLAQGDFLAEHLGGAKGFDLALGVIGLAHPDRTQWYSTATFAGQIDLAPALSLPELHLSGDVSSLYNPPEGAGLMGFMGLNQRFYLRQLAFSPGVRIGGVYQADPARTFRLRPLTSLDLGLDFQASPNFAWHSGVNVMVDPVQVSGGKDVLLNVGFQTGVRISGF